MTKGYSFFEKAYFIKQTRTRTRIFRKSAPRNFRKSEPYTKIYYIS